MKPDGQAAASAATSLPCPECGGRGKAPTMRGGWLPTTLFPCKRCDGSGRVPINTAVPCSQCRGTGTYSDVVKWSDGLGMVQIRCRPCDGTGFLAAAPETLAVIYQRRAELAEAALRHVEVAVALYLATSDGTLPNPPLRDARGPSSSPRVWRETLEEAIKDLPRVGVDA